MSCWFLCKACPKSLRLGNESCVCGSCRLEAFVPCDSLWLGGLEVPPLPVSPQCELLEGCQKNPFFGAGWNCPVQRLVDTRATDSFARASGLARPLSVLQVGGQLFSARPLSVGGDIAGYS